MNLTIEPVTQKILQRGRIFKVPKGQKDKINPVAKKIVELLKQDYPEIAKKNRKREDFLRTLLAKFKGEMPKEVSHKLFAANIIEKITQNPKINSEIEKLSDVLYI
ncbi:MAG: hypothetical protein WCY19_05450 [Candidatus Gastranaerophilaceae bacterium]